LLLGVFIASCARNPVTGKKEFMLMSTGQESAMGAQADPSIVQQFGLYQDETMQKFINLKGNEMARISHMPELQFSFKILDSPVVNAFAVPGGYVYFTRGIMAHFNNEAEFAGVLGHEIGHVTARHSAKQQTSQMLGSLGLMAGMIASPEFAQFANEAQQGLGLLFLKNGRDHESESDKLGVVYSTKIGYDAHEMADFFQTLNRLQVQSGAAIPSFLSTHPNPADRYNTVHQLAKVAQKTYAKGKSLNVNRAQYLQMIDGIIYGEDPRQGFVENNVFYHPELKFQFPVPQGWQLINSPIQVQMVPSDGKSLMLMTLSPEKTLDSAAQAVVEQFKLTLIESQRTTVNGMSAIAMVSDQVPVAENGQAAGDPIRILTYLIEYNGLIYTFHGLSAQADFNRYSSFFKRTMTNFDVLRDQSKINVTPTRIAVKTVTRAGTLSQVLSQLGTASPDFAELAIINGMELSDQIKAGELIKVFSKPFNVK